MSEPFQAALTEERMQAGGSTARDSISLLTTVGDVLLPLDADDAPEASQMERVQAALLSRVGGPSFTAIKQRAENACPVDVHFGILSQVFVFLGSLGQFGPGAGGLADSTGDF